MLRNDSPSLPIGVPLPYGRWMAIGSQPLVPSLDDTDPVGLPLPWRLSPLPQQLVSPALPLPLPLPLPGPGARLPTVRGELQRVVAPVPLPVPAVEAPEDRPLLSALMPLSSCDWDRNHGPDQVKARDHGSEKEQELRAAGCKVHLRLRGLVLHGAKRSVARLCMYGTHR